MDLLKNHTDHILPGKGNKARIGTVLTLPGFSFHFVFCSSHPPSTTDGSSVCVEQYSSSRIQFSSAVVLYTHLLWWLSFWVTLKICAFAILTALCSLCALKLFSLPFPSPPPLLVFFKAAGSIWK